ncbi:MAG: RsmB/NOP family class I SAM-dependent RNA methyltransferase [Planctomycetota bacterium]
MDTGPQMPTPLRESQIEEVVLAMRREQRLRGARLREVLGEHLPKLELGAADRRTIARRAYLMVQQERRVDFALDGALRGRNLSLERMEPLRYAATLLLGGIIDRDDAARRAPRVDWGFVGEVDTRVAAIVDPDRRFALTWSMPDWFAARFRSEFGEEATAIAASLNIEPPLTLRANLLRAKDRDEVAARLAAEGIRTSPTRHAPHGLVVDGAISLFSSDAFKDGLFEQQDEASQLCCLLVAPPPRGRVLDACAGAGGKTLALAAALGNRGDILAIDTHERRLQSLVERRRRAGTDNVRSQLVSEDAWPADVIAFAQRADRILLDVPCSGVGSWRRRPDARWTSTPSGLAELRTTQATLLERALGCLSPGARLIYSTCTLFRDENEAQIETALARDPGLELVRVAEILGRESATPLSDSSGTFLKLSPHRHGTDGFFAAVLRRRRVS